MVSQMLQNSITYYFNKNIYSTSTKIISFNKNIYSTSTKIISFNNNICSTSTNKNSIQQQYLFNFNPNYFHSTKIFIQLQPKIISFNNKVPGHSKYRHSTKIPVPPRLNTKRHWVMQATYQKPYQIHNWETSKLPSVAIPCLEIHSCSGTSYSMTSFNLPEECTLNTYFTGTIKNLRRLSVPMKYLLVCSGLCFD